jgi:Ca-activated chloride channel family protein
VQPAEQGLTELEIDWQGLAVIDVYPRELPDLWAEQTLTVLGRHQGTPPNNIVVRGRAHGQAIEIPVHIELAEPAQLTGVSSIWARRKIDELPVEHEQDIIALALQHGILTEHTSFVTVGEHDMVSINASVQRIEHAQLPELTPLDPHGYIRAGSSTRHSHNRAQFGRPKRQATVYTNSADIQALDVEVVRQVVNPHVHEVRRCYFDALKTNSSLTGTVVISFTIAPNGTVTQSTASSNDTGDEKLGKCIAKLAEDWTFPPGHGNAVVRYPFALPPG